jgi:hypothetical protein
MAVYSLRFQQSKRGQRLNQTSRDRATDSLLA